MVDRMQPAPQPSANFRTPAKLFGHVPYPSSKSPTTRSDGCHLALTLDGATWQKVGLSTWAQKSGLARGDSIGSPMGCVESGLCIDARPGFKGCRRRRRRNDSSPVGQNISRTWRRWGPRWKTLDSGGWLRSRHGHVYVCKRSLILKPAQRMLAPASTAMVDRGDAPHTSKLDATLSSRVMLVWPPTMTRPVRLSSNGAGTKPWSS